MNRHLPTFKDSQQWVQDCMLYHKRLLMGKYRHYCYEWDGMPIDETCKEFEVCICFPSVKNKTMTKETQFVETMIEMFSDTPFANANKNSDEYSISYDRLSSFFRNIHSQLVSGDLDIYLKGIINNFKVDFEREIISIHENLILGNTEEANRIVLNIIDKQKTYNK